MGLTFFFNTVCTSLIMIKKPIILSALRVDAISYHTVPKNPVSFRELRQENVPCS
jgi:hypothetical protein